MHAHKHTHTPENSGCEEIAAEKAEDMKCDLPHADTEPLLKQRPSSPKTQPINTCINH